MKRSLEKILSLVNAAGGIRGRKKFQKIVHILKQNGTKFEESFVYHYYGPYSADLQIEIDALVKLGLLQEVQKNETYQYNITEKGKKFLSNNEFDNPNIVELVSLLNNNQAYILEIVSTIYYLKEKGYTEKNIIKKKIQILKPNLIEHFDYAYELYKKINNFSGKSN